MNILIVEDDAIIAQLIAFHLRAFGYQVLGIAHDSERALDLVYTLQPDLVLLDINLDGQKDGIQIAEIIEEKYNIPYLFITALSDLTTLTRVQKLEPLAYIVKPFKEEDLRVSITIGMSNHKRKTENNPITLSTINQKALSPLSQKELDILLEIGRGLTNKQIGLKSKLSINTVKWHTQNIYSKLGVSNRTSAANFIIDL